MKIKEAFNTYAQDGSIFQYLPMYGTATPQQMGLAYVLRHSGKKVASSLVTEFCDVDGHLTTEGEVTIAGIIETMFKEQWDRIYDALTTEYNPLENYNMEEVGKDTDKMEYGQETTNFTHGAKSSTDTYGSQGGSTTKGSMDSSVEDEISAFNSSSYQDSNKKSTQEGSRTDSFSRDGYTDSHSELGYTDSEVKTAQDDKTTKDHELRRSGNIGVTTSQQMLQSEFDVRAYRFFEQMFRDIDSICALRVYDDYEDDTVQSSGGGSTTDIDVTLTELANGVKISVIKNGQVTQTAEVYNGVTPDFKIEDGDLYVNP